MNLLEDSLLRATQLGGAIRRVSLPQLYAALVADEIEELPALRPHQRHALHALLCQIGALACLATGLSEPPRDAAAWAAGLRALTPDHPDDAPWHLVTDPDRPAFLQAPAPGGISSFKQVETPDALDMLVTAKNHDLKGARMAQPEADDWIFALATLQTMEGFLGAGNYGISRMNGGFANRAAVGLAPASGRMGAHIARDIRRLLVLRPRLLEAYPHYRDDGLALVWLRPWTGADGIDPAELDPFYIEICRRARLVVEGENLAARVSGSKVARIAVNKAENGITGDPWAPIEITKQEPKALTIDARGFSYRRLADIIDFSLDSDRRPCRRSGQRRRMTRSCSSAVRSRGAKARQRDTMSVSFRSRARPSSPSAAARCNVSRRWRRTGSRMPRKSAEHCASRCSPSSRTARRI